MQESALKKYVCRLLIAFASGLLLLNGIFYLLQPQMVFYPTRTLDTTPRAFGMDYQDVSLTTQDGVRLHGWYLPHDGSQHVLLFFHGNAGNISHRGESLAIFHRLGLNILIIDYRGYGRSEGAPSEEGLYRDARAAWNYLVKQRGFKPKQIVVFGRSLGGAVAAHLSAEVTPGGLILESTFASSRDMAARLFPLLSRFIYLRYDFNSALRATERDCPLLMLHSSQDDVIPYASASRLFDGAREPKRFVDLQGDHNSGFLLSQPYYEQELKTFLTSMLK